MVLAPLLEKSIILKYSAEPVGATTYLKTLYFPTTYTFPHDSMCGLEPYNSIDDRSTASPGPNVEETLIRLK